MVISPLPTNTHLPKFRSSGNPPPSYEIASKGSYNGWIIWIFMPCKFLRRAYTVNCSMKKASSTLPHPPQTTPGVWRQKDSLPASHTSRSKQAPESWKLVHHLKETDLRLCSEGEAELLFPRGWSTSSALQFKYFFYTRREITTFKENKGNRSERW